MRLRRLVARGFRNLADLECEPPASGVVLLGANAQGKTNLLEAIYYPVLFRSFRGAPDQEIGWFDGAGFQVEATIDEATIDDPHAVALVATYAAQARRKRILIDGEEPERLADAVGTWLAVSFLPDDVGPGHRPGRRAARIPRPAALARRPAVSAVRSPATARPSRSATARCGSGRPELARVFDVPLAESGAAVVRARQRWAAGAAEQFAQEFECLGEGDGARLRYQGADAIWRIRWRGTPRSAASLAARPGPRHDDRRTAPRRPRARDRRPAAARVRLERPAARRGGGAQADRAGGLRAARGSEPALLLDDVFAAFDRERQRRLARRLLETPGRQVFLTAPRLDELPADLALPVWRMDAGRISA